MADNDRERTKVLLRGYDQVAAQVKNVLTRRFGKEFALEIARDARREYQSLIPQLPDIGGRNNPLTWNLIASAWFLALYRALKSQGVSLEETGNVIEDMMRAWLGRYPRFLLRLLGRLRFTRFYRNRLEKYAQRSQQRRFPEDWVYTVVRGDGTTFEYGVDYTECGIVKFYRAQAATELLPYLCKLDFLMCDAYGIALKRTKTLAQGAEKCDFRLRRAA